MYAQATLKRNIIPHNVAHRIVNRGVQKCTCAGASLRSKKICSVKLYQFRHGNRGRRWRRWFSPESSTTHLAEWACCRRRSLHETEQCPPAPATAPPRQYPWALHAELCLPCPRRCRS